MEEELESIENQNDILSDDNLKNTDADENNDIIDMNIDDDKYKGDDADDDNTLIMEENVINKCHMCRKLFDKKNSLLWVACENCSKWYSCDIQHDMNDSYYCASCFEPKLNGKVYEQTKTSSPVQAPPRNDLIREVKKKQKRAIDQMLESNNKRQKIVDFEKDDKVSVLSMAPDKLVGDMRRVPAIIVSKSGTKDIFYELLTAYGVLDVKYRASDLELYYGDIEISDEVKSKKVSLRSVSKLFNNHPIKQKDISKTHCKCKGKCFEDNRCVCFKNNKKCTSHCENHLSGKKGKCCNVEKEKI